jgi:hypothetical protein
MRSSRPRGSCAHFALCARRSGGLGQHGVVQIPCAAPAVLCQGAPLRNLCAIGRDAFVNALVHTLPLSLFAGHLGAHCAENSVRFVVPADAAPALLDQSRSCPVLICSQAGQGSAEELSARYAVIYLRSESRSRLLAPFQNRSPKLWLGSRPCSGRGSSSHLTACGSAIVPAISRPSWSSVSVRRARRTSSVRLLWSRCFAPAGRACRLLSEECSAVIPRLLLCSPAIVSYDVRAEKKRRGLLPFNEKQGELLQTLQLSPSSHLHPFF